MADENAPTARMISEEPSAPVETDPETGRQTIEVETRRRLIAEPVTSSTAHAGVTGPDDGPVIVVEHAQDGGSYAFAMTRENAVALRAATLRAIQEFDRITADLS